MSIALLCENFSLENYNLRISQILQFSIKSSLSFVDATWYLIGSHLLKVIFEMHFFIYNRIKHFGRHFIKTLLEFSQYFVRILE